jgi:phage baseplate assembly protein W
MAINPVTRISRSFKDISLSFEPHPVTKDLPILKNERAIIRSVRNIVETIPTERFFNSDFGSSVRSNLFGILDYATVSIIEDEIKTSINNYEPRVENIKVIINPELDNNSLEISIIFDIIGQDFPTQEFTFILEATR